ncbi:MULTISPECIES: flagellar protein FliT [unclassified Halomonas]|uniref:flagellar protein FliT n=1 Tax=unclassified Halomonas TaxID=2609666 RepID=UPI0028848A08|nr:MULTISPECIES: flagellar protein FliT [unclassified Halomonas]MDT0500528.1 flagellar protein FliT [Halomonas sp. PAR7]MDT0511576.1 flagellar protein FliT [Halomonas sp. LES1]MDT0590136.1 flagellar protein FliT [Halomonas sp. PAR8]
MPTDTTSSQGVIAAYETMLLQTRRMLEAAHRQEWDTLITCQTEYVLQTEHLKKLDEAVTLTEAHRQQKADLIKRILENNLQLRDQLMTRREELGELIDTSRQQRNLSRAYGVPAGGRQASYLDSHSTNKKGLW